MTEEKLKYKIEQLSSSERKLLAIKTKDFFVKEANRFKLSKQKKIVAYLETEDSLDLEGLKSHLKNTLPDYMIPSTFLEIEKTPLLPNGKIDKKELLKIKNNTYGEEANESAIVKPATKTEENLVKIWEEILDFSPISTQDNFFEIGGDSILSIQITSKVRQLGITLSPNDLFENQSIKDLANFIESKQTKTIIKNNTFKHLIQVKSSGKLPPLFCIHGGGRHFFFYNELSAYVNPERPVYALQASEVEGNLTLHGSIKDMAKDFVKEIKLVSPKGPYHIMGYCFSTVVALEISRILKQEKQSVNLIIADTIAINQNRYAPSKTKRRIKEFFNRLSKNPFRAIYIFIKSRINARIKPVINKNIGTRVEKNIQILRDNLARNYLKYNWVPFDIYISLLITNKDDATMNPEIKDSWHKISEKKEVTVTHIEGHHAELFLEPTVKNTAQELEKCMAQFENAKKQSK